MNIPFYKRFDNTSLRPVMASYVFTAIKLFGSKDIVAHRKNKHKPNSNCPEESILTDK